LIARPFFASLLIALYSSCSEVIAKPKDDQIPDGQKALIIRQSGDYLGSTKTIITPKALRIEIEQSEAYLLATAPKWQVMLCNDANKRALTMNYTDWLKHIPEFTYAGVDWDRFALVTKPLRGLTFLGRPARLYDIVGQRVNGYVLPSNRVTSGTLTVLEDQPIAKEAASIMQKAIGTPQCSGIPVEFMKIVQKTDAFNTIPGKERFLSTRRIEEKLVSPQIFVSPKNYKTAHREVEVLDDPKKRNRVDRAVELFWDGAK
jgi:hypothetical protein